MKKSPIIFLAMAVIAMSCTLSRASFVFNVGAGAVMPDENLEFNEGTLVDNATTIEGITNQTDTIFEIMSNDVPQVTLTSPSGGQARVANFDDGVGFASIMIYPQVAGTYFGELEFNVNVLNMESGTFTLTVEDQNGVSHVDDFSDDTLGSGQNFFSVAGADGMLIRKATLTASGPIVEDVRQIRVGGVVPEPSSMFLGFAGSLLGLASFRRRRS